MVQKLHFTKVAEGSSARDSFGREAEAESPRRNYIWLYQADRERCGRAGALICGAARAVEKGLGSKSENLDFVGSSSTYEQSQASR